MACTTCPAFRLEIALAGASGQCYRIIARLKLFGMQVSSGWRLLHALLKSFAICAWEWSGACFGAAQQ
jgi:hypothetical protein